MPPPATRLLLNIQLEDKLVCSPLFWPVAGSVSVVCATRRRDPDKGGTVAVIRLYGLGGPSAAARDIAGVETHAGSNLGVGDLDGHGRGELIAADAEGRMHVLTGALGRRLGFPTQPSRARILYGPPLVGDFLGDGRRTLLCLSAPSTTNGSESFVVMLDARGQAPPGMPFRLDPPAATGPILARLGGRGDGWPVFARTNGSICTFAPADRQFVELGHVPAATAARAALTAADINGDGLDEVLYGAYGGSEVHCAVPPGRGPVAGWPLHLGGAALEGLAASCLPGRPLGTVICAYEASPAQFRLFDHNARASGTVTVPGGVRKKLAYLASTGLPDGATARFLAVFFEPPAEADVDRVFQSRATSAMKSDLDRFRAATAAHYPSPLPPQHRREIDDKARQYERSLLVDRFGAENTSRLLDGQPATEVWLLDGAGRCLPGCPVRLEGAMPFLDARGERPCRPALVQEPGTGRMLLLIGGNGVHGAGGKVQVHWIA